MKSAFIACVLAGAVAVYPGSISAQTWDIIPPPVPWHPGVGHAVATPKDGKIYVVGGGSNALASKSFFRYNPLSAQIEDQLPPLPLPRAEHAAVAAPDGRIWVIGGLVGPGHPPSTDTVVAYDPGTNQWTTTLPNLTTKRVRPAAAVGSDGRIYVFGGNGTNGAFLESIDPLDPNATWMAASTASPDPSVTVWRATAGHDGGIFLLSQTKKFRFSPPGNFLQLMANPLQSLAGFAITTGSDGRVYRMNPSGVSTRLNPPALTSPLDTNMMSPMSDLEAAVAEGAVYAFGKEGSLLAGEFLAVVPAVISGTQIVWPFQNGFTGNGTACSLTPTTTSATQVPGRAGLAASFGGGQALAYAASSCLNIGSGDISVSVWVRPKPAAVTGIASILDYRAGGASGPGYHVALVGGRPVIQLALGGGNYRNYQVPAAIPANQWTHLAFTVKRAVAPYRLTIWINGAHGQSWTTPLLGNLSSTGPFRIGAHANVPGAGFKGELDELRIFRKALTWHEVRSLFLAGGAQ
ncbi:MAG: hypothetical protein JNK87_11230 [Bryobacterales bacterium]|nr:hypothetical protein [Bryobacterales bacterium]